MPDRLDDPVPSPQGDRQVGTWGELGVPVEIPWVALSVRAVATILGSILVLASVPARNTASRPVAQELRSE